MRWIEWARGRPFSTSLGVGLLLGTLAGLLWPVQVPPPGAEVADAWEPPGSLASLRPTESEFAFVRDAQVWGADGSGPGARGPQKAGWRLVGIIADPVPGALLTTGGGSEVTRVAAGAQLPDGSTVERVTLEGIVFLRNGCAYERALFATEDAPVGACAADAARKPREAGTTSR